MDKLSFFIDIQRLWHICFFRQGINILELINGEISEQFLRVLVANHVSLMPQNTSVLRVRRMKISFIHVYN